MSSAVPPNPHQVGPFSAALQIAAAFLALATPLATGAWALAHGTRQQAISTLLIFGATLPLVVLLPALRGFPSKYLLAPLLSVALLAAGVANLGTANVTSLCQSTQCPTSAPTNVVSPTGTPSAIAAITIEQPEGSIPYCNTFRGHVAASQGMLVVVFDRPLDSNDRPEGRYYFDGATAPVGEDWRIQNIRIGDKTDSDAGQHVEITAILVEKAEADFLNSVEADANTNTSWTSEYLPSGTAAHISVVRGADIKECA